MPELCVPSALSAAPVVPAMKRRESFYLPALDGIRAIAFLLVFVAHAGFDKIVPGGLGVTIFFFLSGYLITTLLRLEAGTKGSISLIKFYIRRCRRILPPLYITMALWYVAMRLGWVPGAKMTLGGVMSVVFYYFNYAQLSGALALPLGLGVVWSLMIEEHFYFLFPFLYRRFTLQSTSRQTQVNILLAICALVLVWRSVLVFYLHTPLTVVPRWTYSATDARFDSILWGCLLAIGWNPWFEDPFPLYRKFKGWLAAGGFALLIGTLVLRNPQFRESLRYTLQGIAFLPIFYYLLSTRSLWTRFLETKPMREIGHLSYSMYLIHPMMLLFAARLMHHNPLRTAALAMLGCLAFGAIARATVENPLRRMIRA